MNPGELGGPQDVTVHGDQLGAPQLGDEPREHGPVALADRPDRDLRLVHPVIMQPRML